MARLGCVRRYLVFLAAGNLAWETFHMPLYGLWETGTYRQIIVYGLHCLAGDILIGMSALVMAILVFGDEGWPANGYRRVATWAIVFGFGYTVGSEWYNVQFAGRWAYSEWMPLIPVLGVGVSPRFRGSSCLQPASGGQHCHRIEAINSFSACRTPGLDGRAGLSAKSDRR